MAQIFGWDIDELLSNAAIQVSRFLTFANAKGATVSRDTLDFLHTQAVRIFAGFPQELRHIAVIIFDIITAIVVFGVCLGCMLFILACILLLWSCMIFLLNVIRYVKMRMG
jgi:hypothetical protein